MDNISNGLLSGGEKPEFGRGDHAPRGGSIPRNHALRLRMRADSPDCRRVAGIDEAGRGPLAGPVVAAAVILPAHPPCALAVLLDDSKKLTPDRRQIAFVALRAAQLAGLVQIGVGAASVTEIAGINILQAALLAMRRAVLSLPELPDLALVDGNQPPDLPCEIRCVVGGDASILSISAASIVAKVLRDRAMARLAMRYPAYGWEVNAGYGTLHHRAALRLVGATIHHRAAFGTVRQLAMDLAPLTA